MIVMMPTMKEMPDLLRALGRNSTIHTHHPFSHLFSFIFLLFCCYLYFFQYLGFEFWSHFDLNCRNPTRDELNTIMAEVRHFIIEWLVLFAQPFHMDQVGYFFLEQQTSGWRRPQWKSRFKRVHCDDARPGDNDYAADYDDDPPIDQRYFVFKWCKNIVIMMILNTSLRRLAPSMTLRSWKWLSGENNHFLHNIVYIILYYIIYHIYIISCSDFLIKINNRIITSSILGKKMLTHQSINCTFISCSDFLIEMGTDRFLKRN